MFELKIGVKRKMSRMSDPDASTYDEEFRQIKIHVALMAQFICQACFAPTSTGPGEAAQGYFEVHHIDDNHRNNDLDNLIFLCPFCHMVFTAGRHGDDFETGADSAELLWLPSITQNTLNLLAHIVFQTKCTYEHKKEWSIISGHPANWINEKSLQAVENIEQMILDFGKKKLKEVFNLDRNFESKHLYNFLVEASDAEYHNRLEVYHGLRLWPKYDKFLPMIEFVSKRGVILKKIGGILNTPKISTI
jgi:hypothetical protein